MERTAGRACFRGKCQGLNFELEKFEMLIRHSNGNIKERGQYTNLKFIGEILSGGRTLGAMRLAEVPRV